MKMLFKGLAEKVFDDFGLAVGSLVEK